MVIAFLLVTGCKSPRGYRILVPEGFSGLARIYYNVPGAEQLTEDGLRLVVLNENGIAHIPPEKDEIGGKPYSEYWLYSGNSRKKMSPDKLGGGATIKQKNSLGQQEIFFEFEVLKEERPH